MNYQKEYLKQGALFYYIVLFDSPTGTPLGQKEPKTVGVAQCATPHYVILSKRRISLELGAMEIPHFVRND